MKMTAKQMIEVCLANGMRKHEIAKQLIPPVSWQSVHMWSRGVWEPADESVTEQLKKMMKHTKKGG